MTIDEAVKLKVESVLKSQEYCTRSQIIEIVEDAIEEAEKHYQRDIDKVNAECYRLLQMNDRLWDAIQKLSEPKFPKVRQFFSFRWLKFWRNWDFSWLQFWKK
jgi:hypothetical protein